MSEYSPFSDVNRTKREQALRNHQTATDMLNLRDRERQEALYGRVPEAVRQAVLFATESYEEGQSPIGQTDFNFGFGDEVDKEVFQIITEKLKGLESSYPGWTLTLMRHDFENQDGSRGGYLIHAQVMSP